MSDTPGLKHVSGCGTEIGRPCDCGGAIAEAARPPFIELAEILVGRPDRRAYLAGLLEGAARQVENGTADPMALARLLRTVASHIMLAAR